MRAFSGTMAAILSLIPSTAIAVNAPVPKEMLGVWWKGGDCKTPAAKLIITKTTAQLGTSKGAPIVYYQDDAGAGEGAIHWREERNVDNFVYDKSQDAIIYNSQGYHMPGRILYKRCQ